MCLQQIYFNERNEQYMNERHFFLGASSPDGFVSAVNDIISDSDNTIFILKGTAGSGKSTLMKKIAAAFSDCSTDIFHCSADPFSLDAVYIADKKAFILDGTSPHCYDPKYPKAVDTIIDLGAFIDPSILRKEKKAVISLTDTYSTYHTRCRYCLCAISSILTDICSCASELINKNKLNSFIIRTVRRMIPRKNEYSDKGRIVTRQLSAATMNGYSTYIPEKYSIYLLSDDNIAAASAFLASLTAYAQTKGYDCFVSTCLLSNDRYYEHVIIPELKLAFLTSSFFNDLEIESPKKVIRFNRFYSSDSSDNAVSIKKRIKFGKKAVNELLKEIFSELRSAKAIHDKIEDYYKSAVDFDSLNRTAYRLISEIKSL